MERMLVGCALILFFIYSRLNFLWLLLTAITSIMNWHHTYFLECLTTPNTRDLRRKLSSTVFKIYATLFPSAALRRYDSLDCHDFPFCLCIINLITPHSAVKSSPACGFLMGGNFGFIRYVSFHHEPHSFEAHTRGASPRNLSERTPLINLWTHTAYQIAAHARSHAHTRHILFIYTSLSCGVITPNFILSPHTDNTVFSCAAIGSTDVGTPQNMARTPLLEIMPRWPRQRATRC